MESILLATGQENLNNLIDSKVINHSNYEIINKVETRNDFIEFCQNNKPNIAIITNNLKGTDYSVMEVILTVKRKLPNLRIIYLAGLVELKDKEKVQHLGALVAAGIYDIYHESKVSVAVLRALIEIKKKREDVKYLLKYEKADVIYEDEIVQVDESYKETIINKTNIGYDNVFVFSSIKPGTGKSFLATNVALNIAKYGKTQNGKLPKVALIDSDLQNLSIGTLLGIDNNKYNINTVMNKISTIVNREGVLCDDELKIKTVNEFIKNSLIPYSAVPNLHALTGSQLTFEDVDDIKNFDYTYLVELILEDYDVIIIDTNSSLQHVTTMSLLDCCSKAFYIINLDFNNIRNNSRLIPTLKTLGLESKINYILNEDIDEEYLELIGVGLLEHVGYKEDALALCNINIIGSVPLLPKEVFLNRVYQAMPIVLDENDYTLIPRLAFSKICNRIWEMDNIEWLESECKKWKEKKTKSRRKIK